ncbi:unnamed protein product [Candida verbasci]|uniref:CBM21 domain-containing protein n=1 Tax=Candida verbasci TaxID=1227364 RepID=A0A9W4XC45_9ASCO|nr:unnamed protein product [Candida verbasci]
MSTTITSSREDLLSTSPNTTTTTITHPLTYTNLLSSTTSSSTSSSLPRDSSSTNSYFTQNHKSNSSTIDLGVPIIINRTAATPTPPPELSTTSSTTTTKPKIKIPNYYVAPKHIQHQVSQPTTTTYLNPPPLIRMKSGQLLKPSLKRCSSSPNFGGNIIPSSSPRKSVKFASRLFNIKTFDGCDSPSTVNSASPSSPLDFTDSSTSDDDDDEDIDYFTTTTKSNLKKTEYKMLKHNIRLNNNDVISLVQSYIIKMGQKYYLQGLLNVQNLHYEKHIIIKISVDNWCSSIILSGPIINYHRQINSSLDQFKFNINLENIINSTTTTTTTTKTTTTSESSNITDLQLCFKLEMGNQTYWANNYGQNYKFQIKSLTKEFQSPSTNSFDSYDLSLRLNKLKLESDFISPKTSTRPIMTKSFSDLNLSSSTNLNTPKYSHRQKNKNINLNPTISSLSYEDLLKKYCFSSNEIKNSNNNTTTTTTKDSNVLVRSCSSLPSTASTLYSFTDQVHI